MVRRIGTSPHTSQVRKDRRAVKQKDYTRQPLRVPTRIAVKHAGTHRWRESLQDLRHREVGPVAEEVERLVALHELLRQQGLHARTHATQESETNETV